MPEERDELERAWQALTERERLLQQTMARRSGEIDARARRFDEIAADLDARRQLIQDAEEELVDRERRLTLGEQELEDRREEIERAEGEVERVRQQALELDARASELRVLASELEERGDWIATASAALEAQERRANAVAAQAAELEGRWTELKDEERVHDSALRQLDTKAAEFEATAAKLAVDAQKIEQARNDVEPLFEAAKKLKHEVEQR